MIVHSNTLYYSGLVEYLRVLIPVKSLPCLGCEPATEEDMVYIEVEGEVVEEQGPAKDEDSVDYYFEYRRDDINK